MDREYHAKIKRKDWRMKTMNKVAQFEKVSFEQFLGDFIDTFEEFDYSKPSNVEILRQTWDNIRLPKRSTVSSAGYDFYSPIDFELNPGEEIKIPTGIRCKIDSDWVLTIHPRSSLGFKYQIGLANTTGIIDSDYYNSDNEGHIMVKLINRGNKKFSANKGDKIVQGIFLPYGITVDDNSEGIRNGGFGSTGR